VASRNDIKNMDILVGAVHLNRLWRLGSIAATCGNFGDWVNRRYLIESIAAISKFVRVIRVHS